MKCRKVYFISGLGADHQVFKYIRLPEGMVAVHLHWLKPGKTETLQEYAARLAEHIDIAEPFALVGLSFGGMLATEIAKRNQPQHIILISSIPLSAQLPGYFRIAAALRLHRIVPVGLVKFAATSKRLFTNEKNEDKKLIRELIRNTDPFFLRWAMGAILQWKNEQVPFATDHLKDNPASFTHIHGTSDAILPSRYTRPTHRIPKAGHLMVMTRPKAINAILQEVLG